MTEKKLARLRRDAVIIHEITILNSTPKNVARLVGTSIWTVYKVVQRFLNASGVERGRNQHVMRELHR